MPGIAPSTISRHWRAATFAAMSRRVATAWHGLGHRQTEDRHADASPCDEDPPETRRLSQSLSVTKTGGRTRVWSDQTGARIQTVLAAGPVAGRRGVEFGLQRAQPAEIGRSQRVNPVNPHTILPGGTPISRTRRRVTESLPLAAGLRYEQTSCHSWSAITRTGS